MKNRYLYYNDCVLLSYLSKFNDLTPGQQIFFMLLGQKITKIGVLIAHYEINFFPFSLKIASLKFKNMEVLVVFDGFWDKKVEFRFWRTDISAENHNNCVVFSHPSKLNGLT